MRVTRTRMQRTGPERADALLVNGVVRAREMDSITSTKVIRVLSEQR
jgi:hypothetical protein